MLELADEGTGQDWAFAAVRAFHGGALDVGWQAV